MESEIEALKAEVADLRRREGIIVYYLQHLLAPAWQYDLVRDLESNQTAAEIANG